MARGVVLGVERCALHDGDGIRSVVFLKGCPLRCVWCCNPESQSLRPQLFYRRRICRGCGACAEVCSSGALCMTGDGVQVDFAACAACGRCAEVCPENAVGLYGYLADTDTVIGVLARDERYYEASGGGITLSGGEPLLQEAFAVDLLRTARQRGWRTAVETTGCVRAEVLREAAVWTDEFLFDYKLSDPDAHRSLTGGEHRLVLDALHLLDSLGARVVLRAMLLPGVNDTDGHLRAIVDLQRQMPAVRGIDVMPLHAYAAVKYGDLGIEVPELYAVAASAQQSEAWIERLRAAGAVNVKLG